MSAFSLCRDGSVLWVGFGEPATGDAVVRDAVRELRKMETSGELAGGGLLCVNGRCSVPVAIMLGHALAHLFSAVAVFDPKLDRYIVSISHDPDLAVGQLIEAGFVHPADPDVSPLAQRRKRAQ